MKAQHGNNLHLGGAGISAAFMRLGLVNECWLYVCPVAAGGSKPLFPALEAPVKLRLVEARTFTSGVALLRYEAAKN